jgi:hypothetical protein
MTSTKREEYRSYHLLRTFCKGMRINWPKTSFRPIGTEGMFAGLRLVSASAAFHVEVSSFSRPLALSTKSVSVVYFIP